MKTSESKTGWLISLLTVFLLVLSSCDSSGGGGGSDVTDDDDSDDTTTTQVARISGSVTLSSSVAGSNKPSILMQKSAASGLQYKMSPTNGVQVLSKPTLTSEISAIPLMAIGDAVADAYVYLYDAEHPEWLGPVAQDVTGSSGDYEFEAYGCTDRVSTGACSSDAATNGDAYVDGDPLPFGIYTMLIYKPSTFDPISGVTTDPIVSVLPAFKADSEDLQVEEAEAEVSDATPNLVTMFGLKKNTDGTNTWGSVGTQLPGNSSIQITFDMAMSRGSVQNITVSNGSNVSGRWSLSADWRSATFEPDSPLSAGTYTVTVPSTTVNVYSNAMGYAATGTFTAVAVDTTAPTVSVTSPATTTNVPATTPIRLTSNEPLKVNSLRVESTPSIGDFPSFVLVDSDGSSYKYEVAMTESLKLGTSYSMTFSGIKDGAGNAAADLNLSFSTQAASSAAGVDAGATEATQNAQVAISEIFAKWLLAIDERNAATIASLMSGSFVFEYSVQAEDGFMDHDVNRNGRLSLKEFMSMIEEGMLHWEFCGTTVSGDIIGNVELASAESGNFEFVLNFSSDNQSQDCSDDGGESIYATVKKVNGLWKLARMSEGFDHRGTPLTSISLIEAKLYENDPSAEDGLDWIQNWEQMDNFADNQTPLTFKFDHVTGVESYVFLLANERDPSKLGFAFTVSADRLACGDEQDCSAQDGDELEISVPDPFGDNGMPNGAYPVLDLFGFDDERDWGIENPGEIFLWEIIGLGTLTSQELAGQNPPTVVELVRDIEAVSAVKRFQNPGDFVDLGIEVEAIDLGLDDSLGGGDDVLTALEYNIYNGGFDAGSADYIHVSVVSPDPNGDILALQSGNEPFFYAHSPIGYMDAVTTITNNGDGTVTLEADMMLFNGWTYIEVNNGINRWESFQVVTTGGRLPDVAVTSNQITGTGDTAGTPVDYLLNLDQWNFVDGSSDSGEDASANPLSFGVDTVDVSWTVVSGDGIGIGAFDIDDVMDMLTDFGNAGANACDPGARAISGWANMEINVWNDEGAYANVRYCDEQSNTPTGSIGFDGTNITIADLEVFNGDNWISLNIWGDDGSNDWYDTHSSFGIYTDAGSVFVPPIALDTIVTSEGPLDEIGNWGQGSDWDATDVTAATSDVDIQITFAVAQTSPMVDVGADGICCNNPTLNTSDNTTYTFTVTLYNGYNWINIQDDDGNWYSLNIFTENGQELPKPKFLTANGVAIPEPADPYAQLQVTVDQCNVTVTGTAPDNTTSLYVNWDGGNLSDNFWEGQEIVLPGDTGFEQDWSATFQLVGGSGSYNNINLWDQTNNTGAWMSVFTTASGCTYSEPLLNVTGVRLSNSTDLYTEDSYEYTLNANFDPVTDTSVFVYGTTNIPGRFIGINSYLCGSELKVGAQAQSTETSAGSGLYAWQVEVPLFDNDAVQGNVDMSSVYPFNQNIGVHDGWSYTDLLVVSDSGELPPAPAMSLTTPGGVVETSSGCANASWDGTAQTTSLTDLTISGNTTNVADSYGQVYLQDGWIDFYIDGNGDFTVNIPLYDGFNYINFDDMHGGFFSVDIQTANGVFPPQYVFITSHATTDEGITGATTISGDYGSSGFSPDWMYGYVQICDNSFVCTYTNYDSELTVANEYGDLPMFMDGSGFSLDIDIPNASYSVYVDVYGCGMDGCHGHSFTFNDGGADEDHYYKPSSGSGGASFHHRSRQLSR